MTMRFRRSFRVAPGLRLNLGKRFHGITGGAAPRAAPGARLRYRSRGGHRTGAWALARLVVNTITGWGALSRRAAAVAARRPAQFSGRRYLRSQYPAAAGKTGWTRIASGAPSSVSAAARQTA